MRGCVNTAGRDGIHATSYREICPLEYTTGDNEIAAEARSQWRSFAIESAVRSQLLEEGVKREEVGEQVGDLLRDDRFMATFSKVGLYSSMADFEQKSGQNIFWL